FRSDIATFVPREVVEGCVVLDRRELPRQAGVTYVGFLDPSGGSADAFTIAIAHKTGECVTLDCLREIRPPFSPDSAAAEFSALLKSYGVLKVQGDKYAGVWPVEVFRKCGITYEQNARPKSELYQGLLPLLNSGRVELLDVP